MYRSPPKCGSLCNTINDIGKSRYQQYSWTNTVFRFDFGSFSFSSFLFFFFFFFSPVNFTTSRDKRNHQCFDPNWPTNFAIYKESSKVFFELKFSSNSSQTLFFSRSRSLSFSFLTHSHSQTNNDSILFTYVQIYTRVTVYKNGLYLGRARSIIVCQVAGPLARCKRKFKNALTRNDATGRIVPPPPPPFPGNTTRTLVCRAI